MKKFKKNWLKISVVFALISFVLIIIVVCLLNSSLLKGSIAAVRSYDNSKMQAQQEVYDDYYSEGYKCGEEKNHISNDVSITIDDIKEIFELEVLEIQDTVFITNNDEEKETVWFKAEATGVFTVNLNAGEFIVDSDRHYILVRVPSPELNVDTINIENTEKLLFKDNKFNSSTSDGVQLAQKMLGKAKEQVKDDFLSSQNYTNSAKNSAVTLIKRMICALNYNVDDLTVDVEFYKS